MDDVAVSLHLGKNFPVIGVIGSRTRVYEVMNRKRPLSISMIRTLHAEMQIPYDCLMNQDLLVTRIP